MRTRVIERIISIAAVVGGFISFVAQWLIFQPGNFSDSAGPAYPVYIPVGENGTYTSKALGFAWHGGIVLALVCLVLIAVWYAKERRGRS